jgi:hypothetical protein
MRTLGLRHSSRARRTFCWFPDLQLGDELTHQRIDPTGGDQAHPGQPRQRPENDAVADGKVGQGPLHGPVLGEQRDTRSDGGRGCASAHRLSVDDDGSGVDPLSAEHGQACLGPSGSEQPGETDDLPWPDAEEDPVQQAPSAEPLDLEGGWERVRVLVLVGFQVAQSRRDVLPAQHRGDQLGAEKDGEGAVVDRPAFAQHRDGVADLVELVQTVAEVDDRDAPHPEPVDHPEWGLHLARLERGRRLVHDVNL